MSGCCQYAGQEWVKSLYDSVVERSVYSKDQHPFSYLMQRPSVAVEQDNAASVLGTMGCLTVTMSKYIGHVCCSV